MKSWEFRSQMFNLACINIHQIYAWQPDFDRNNLTRWIKKGYITRLRQGYYTFSEYKDKPDYSRYFANRIYRPSYISLQSALAFYGLIPEAVVQITSVTSLKTASFLNGFGEYVYKNVKENLMFGYTLRPMADHHTLQMATPEKALLDLFYLYPFYNSQQELEQLRLDEDFLHDGLDKEQLMEYCSRFQNKTLDQRVKLFLHTYDL